MKVASVSCYFRHVKDILETAGIEATTANKKEIDRVFHQIVGVDYKNCPATWKRLKQEWIADKQKRAELIQKLQIAIHQDKE